MLLKTGIMGGGGRTGGVSERFSSEKRKKSLSVAHPTHATIGRYGINIKHAGQMQRLLSVNIYLKFLYNLYNISSQSVESC